MVLVSSLAARPHPIRLLLIIGAGRAAVSCLAGELRLLCLNLLPVYFLRIYWLRGAGVEVDIHRHLIQIRLLVRLVPVRLVLKLMHEVLLISRVHRSWALVHHHRFVKHEIHVLLGCIAIVALDNISTFRLFLPERALPLAIMASSWSTMSFSLLKIELLALGFLMPCTLPLLFAYWMIGDSLTSWLGLLRLADLVLILAWPEILREALRLPELFRSVFKTTFCGFNVAWLLFCSVRLELCV